ncbi:MAG TPA: hypothetical protein PKC98_09335, partial [Candidatus Melainabacteria bacterium]|nr:hypothetical protein [Candidatus Melainabacteria bacterium]
MNKGKQDSAPVSTERLSAILGTGDIAIKDALAGRLAGVSFSAGAKSLTLPPRSISIWKAREGNGNGLPEIASISPGVIHGGKPVTVGGIGFGEKQGQVLADGESLSVRHWSDRSVEFTSPS